VFTLPPPLPLAPFLPPTDRVPFIIILPGFQEGTRQGSAPRTGKIHQNKGEEKRGVKGLPSPAPGSPEAHGINITLFFLYLS